MKLLDYWPTRENVGDCIRSDADAAAAAVVLAVHRPMRLRRVEPGGVSTRVTEDDLLRHFLQDNPQDGRILIPIVGSSGVGKSHLIRWLGIQMDHAPGTERRHVIRIPKGASLRSALELILTGLEGPGYEAIRQGLQSARTKLDPIQAETLVRAQLVIGLKSRVQELRSRLINQRQRNEPLDPDEQAYVEWVGNGLADWLDTPTTRENLMGERGILTALTTRVLTGYDPAKEMVLRSEFHEDDFKRGPASGGSSSLRMAIQRLNATDENGGAKNRALAVRELNKLVDPAIAQLIRPGDTDLHHLFEDIRKELLGEGKELVLLVEDFANLSGIQGALLQAMIADATHGGQRRLCDIRVALAVTPGYMDSHATGQTRAVYQWVVDEGSLAESEHLNEVVEFVGGYLNAARFGKTELDRQLTLREGNQTDWIPRFDPREELDEKERSQLEAFGTTTSGVPLFPFNRAALEFFARQHLREGNQLTFLPRFILTRFLQPILREHREAFQNGRFPPEQYPGFDGNQLEAEIIQKLLKGQAPEKRQRYEVLLGFWGGRPQTVDQLRLPAEVYQAFGLAPLQSSRANLPLEVTTPATLPAGQVGREYRVQWTAQGGASPYRWSGINLPTGWTLDGSTGDMTAPATSIHAGEIHGTVRCTDATGGLFDREFNLRILSEARPPDSQNSLIILTPANLPDGQSGVAYRQSLEASGGAPPHQWHARDLPEGWTCSTVGQLDAPGPRVRRGVFSFSIVCTDGLGQSAIRLVHVTVQASDAEKKIEARMVALRDWRQGNSRLVQTPSRELRRDIVRSVRAAIDWDAQLLKPISLEEMSRFFISWVYVPNADGVEDHCTPEKALAVVCRSETLRDPDLATEVEVNVKAVVRSHEYGTFDRDEGEEDYVRYANFVRLAVGQATQFVQRRYLQREAELVAPLVDSLALGARILGLSASPAADDLANLEAVFLTAESLDPGETRWQKIRHEASLNRAGARELLLRVVAARQGGATAHAIDAARLLNRLRAFRLTLRVEGNLPGDLSGTLPKEVQQARAYVKCLQTGPVDAAVNERKRELLDWHERATNWFGIEFDKDELIQNLREAVNDAVSLGDVYSGDVAHNTLLDRVRTLQKLPLKESFRELTRLKEELLPDKLLTMLAGANDLAMKQAEDAWGAYDAFLTGTEKKLRQRLVTELGEIDKDADLAAQAEELVERPLKQAVTEVEDLLAALEKSARTMVEGGAP